MKKAKSPRPTVFPAMIIITSRITYYTILICLISRSRAEERGSASKITTHPPTLNTTPPQRAMPQLGVACPASEPALPARHLFSDRAPALMPRAVT